MGSILYGMDTSTHMKERGESEGKAVESNAPFHMITGVGGGGLETPAPLGILQTFPRHHYVMVHINGGTLELKSYSLNDRLFDQLQIKK